MALPLNEVMRRERDDHALLIAFEGPDGSGKTTQRKLLTDWLAEREEAFVVTKWNSSPPFKPLIKAGKANHSLSPEEFAVLHAADFRYRYENSMLPALKSGKIVVSDRYAFTGVARDVARGLDRDWSMALYTPIDCPDITFYFSASPETCATRIRAHREPKYYEAGQDVTGIDDASKSFVVFIRKVIDEYERLSMDYPFVVVDAEQSIYDQHCFIRNLIEDIAEIRRVRLPALATSF